MLATRLMNIFHQIFFDVFISLLISFVKRINIFFWHGNESTIAAANAPGCRDAEGTFYR